MKLFTKQAYNKRFKFRYAFYAWTVLISTSGVCTGVTVALVPANTWYCPSF